MPLFDIPQRAGKQDDIKVVKSTKKQKPSTATVRGGGGILKQINAAKYEVDEKLGYLKDKYSIITDLDVFKSYLNTSLKNGIISIDTETTGLDPMLDKIAGLCLYTPTLNACYVPINHESYITGERVANQLTEEQVREPLIEFFNNNIESVMFNGKFDVRVIRNQLKVPNVYCTWDCFLAQRLLNENEESNQLKILHQKYVLNGKGDAFTFDDLFKGIPFTKVPITTGYLYAAHDPEITYELYEFQKPYLTADNPVCIEKDLTGVSWVFHNIEMPCLPIFADLEDNGIEFDFNKANELSVKYHAIMEKCKKSVYDEISVYDKQLETYRIDNAICKLSNPLNIDSPTQLAILLYDIIQVGVIDRKSPRGTGVDILKQIDLPLCKAILEYRAVGKLISTYIDKLPDCVNPNDGRIHCNFKQIGADTGRVASDSPNLQNIPSHNHEIRQMFKAKDGYVLMSSDFSSQEPKSLAAMCAIDGDRQMLDTFLAGKDLYAEIASLSFGFPYEQCLEFNADGTTNPDGKKRRTSAKSVLLGTLYGRGTPSVAEQLNVSKEKAQSIKDSVFKNFPAIKKFEKDSLNMAYNLGFVTTLCGRKRRLPDYSLPEFEFESISGTLNEDLLDFTSDISKEVPTDIQNSYLRKLKAAPFNKRQSIIESAKCDGIIIRNNGGKIADAQRQCVNARIQGTAADLTKLAMIDLANNERLKELGFKMLIPVHDKPVKTCRV